MTRAGLADMSDAVLAFDAIRQEFPAPGSSAPIRVIDGSASRLASGQFVAVIGPAAAARDAVADGRRPVEADTRRGAPPGRMVDDVNREVGFVPQQAQLFREDAVGERRTALLLRGVTAAERKQRVARARGRRPQRFEHYFPGQLSGGMQKRDRSPAPWCTGRRHPDGRTVRRARRADQDGDAGRPANAVTRRRRDRALHHHDITEAVLLADSVVVMSQRPARLLARIAIDLPRPRDVFEPFRNPGFEAAYQAVWSVFRSQVDIRQRSRGERAAG